MESPLALVPGLALELRIYVTGLEWSLMIDEARVQWVSGQIVGLAFFGSDSLSRAATRSGHHGSRSAQG